MKMDFKNDTLDALLKELSSLDVIELSDIPNIDLYMDQITTFFDDKLGPWKLDKEDKVLTKTMINNYTKADVLFPPVKKKYSKEHIILLILIYHLKQVLSINEIHTLLSPIVKKNMSKTSDTHKNLHSLYEAFIKIQKEEMQGFEERFSDKMKNLFDSFDGEEKDRYALLFMIIMHLVISSSIQKNFAQKLIRQFPDILA
ncbi:DUF1836 domain-containing protein [Defluviitalea raffinosedens]|jgi:DNA-binding transcriptional MerR regulator|uniref:DUF1836 domain-containing protein n=2 Tax=Defluviitalea raffinosedens TaxID=1450156 RepID=A0A7C8LFC3_9FIRM|nr:DUF1836 domain-containing protein [Defluviitalea raffinosedens]